jgi:Fe2+ or Zn2+ uptake regulation protein
MREISLYNYVKTAKTFELSHSRSSSFIYHFQPVPTLHHPILFCKGCGNGIKHDDDDPLEE